MDRGSSPRARGTPLLQGIGFRYRRFIPACAGNTAAFFVAAGFTTVHPRVRGEHGSRGPSPVANRGSSPRARGTPMSGQVVSLNQTVHPRVRGEHLPVLNVMQVTGGSSPRARGTLTSRPVLPVCTRFIPACAGNTTAIVHAGVEQAVHPRVRGEHLCSARPSLRANGSSPRARGTRIPGSKTPDACRFIPACAGNT